MVLPDPPPNLTLQPGDIVFAAEGGLLRLDAEMKPQRIVISDELAAIRGVAAESSRTILVRTHVCGGGECTNKRFPDQNLGADRRVVDWTAHESDLQPSIQQRSELRRHRHRP
jgi:hypothetical protein